MKNTGTQITAARQFVDTRDGLTEELAKLHHGIEHEQQNRKNQLFTAILRVNAFVSYIVKTQKLSSNEAVNLAQSIQELIEMNAEALAIKIGQTTPEERKILKNISEFQKSIDGYFRKVFPEDFKDFKPSLIALLSEFWAKNVEVNEYIQIGKTQENALNIAQRAFLQKQTKAKVGNILNAKK